MTDKAPCPDCGKVPNWYWECSRIPCTQRKTISAAPPACPAAAPRMDEVHLQEEAKDDQ